MATEAAPGVWPAATPLLDVNVLIALAWPQHLHHDRASRWFDTVSGWATTPVTESGFIRVSTTPAVVGRTVTPVEAIGVLHAIRALPGHRFFPDDTSLAEPAVDLLRLATRRQVTDAHLVNVAARHQGVLATLDTHIPALLDVADRGLVLVLP